MRPASDAYGWLVWGYQTVHVSLDLGGAPSWKPLTYLFTVPFALFGHYEIWLWMFFSAAVALAGAGVCRMVTTAVGPAPGATVIGVATEKS